MKLQRKGEFLSTGSSTSPWAASGPTPSSPAAASMRRAWRSWRPASAPAAFCSPDRPPGRGGL